MKYITGIIAMGTECSLNTPGLWNIPKEMYLDDEVFKTVESDDSPFKDWGIETNKLVKYREFCLYNVANHVRAYVDMLYDGKFEELKDLFFEAINDSKSRKDIFMLVYGKLRHLAQFKKINEFMEEEFGNAWLSYIDSVNSVAEHISNQADATERLQEIQKIAEEMKIQV